MRTRTLLMGILGVVALLVTISGCNTDALPTGDSGYDGSALLDGSRESRADFGVDAPPGPDLFGTCIAPLTFCNLSCVDTSSDGTNCGRCGKACGPKEVCAKGACEPCPLKPLFALPLKYVHPKAISPVMTAIGDINNDGRPDLATADWGSHSVSVLLNQGNGLFGPGIHIDISMFNSVKSAAAVAVGDLDGDGLLDFAAVDSGGKTLCTATQVYHNGILTYFTGMAPASLVMGDFNGDNHLDIVVANSGSNDFSVLLNLNNGEGKLSIFGSYATGMGPRSIAAGDWNGDGNLDVAIANATDNNLSVRLNRGNGAFGAAANYSVGSSPWSVVAGDLDGDGKLDLAVANHNGANVSVLLNQGGGFGGSMNYPAGNGPQGVAVGDFDGDGKADLAVADGVADVAILLNKGGGVFASPVYFGAGGDPSSIAVGDLNGDGRPDIAVSLPDQNAVAVLLNQAGECQ